MSCGCRNGGSSVNGETLGVEGRGSKLVSRRRGTVFFFFNDTATTEIYTLSLHDALPICAVATGVPILQPIKLRELAAFEQLQAWAPDVIVVAAFGQILKQNVLDLPPYGCINVCPKAEIGRAHV